MGLQIWPPRRLPLSSMACLDVETPTICRVLQLCLQQRRTREQLVDQGIMPPLKTPAAFHEKIRSLERARTGNFLKHKLCTRPERSDLVRLHILQETQVQPALQATEIRLKKARLADDLNDKIAQRPGPMELVEKKILPVDSVENLVNGRKADQSATSDVYAFDEDGSDASPPPHLDSEQSPGSTVASAGIQATHGSTDTSNPTQQTSASLVDTTTFSNQPGPPSSSSGPLLIKQSLVKVASDRSRSRKSKEPKPRVKKLKYHQYIPPDQKQELSELPMDSSYARLLQQQQQFLQLQILNQQQQQYTYQGIVSATLRSTNEVETSCPAAPLKGKPASGPVKLHPTQTNPKLDHLPANLDEMKVAELKTELKLRSLPVSGTKTDLIERLKSFRESSNVQAVPIEMAASPSESTKSTLPVSVIASRVSSLGIEDSCDTQNPPAQEPCLTETTSTQKDSDRDKRLHEKERQIEELKRKLEYEQKLVEELKMQLEVEKRSQPGASPPQPGVKEESKNLASCTVSSPGLPTIKQEELAKDQTSPNQFLCGQQTITLQSGHRSVQDTPLPFSAASSNSVEFHPVVSGAAAGHIQTSGHQPQKAESPPQQTQSLTEPSCSSSSPLTLQRTEFTGFVSISKDPPRYEDAIKQTRSMLAVAQGSSATSQQMDDLFDVLIESGEIPPFIREDPVALDESLPVTASVTTLPVNTALSRPPPLVQVAQLPTAPLDPCLALTSDTQLGPLLDRRETEPLMEELMSPVATMEVDLNENVASSCASMDWLELTLPVTAEGVNPLDVPAGVFSSDFLHSHELNLNWESC